MVRISTSTLYNNNVTSMDQLQTALQHTQQQISSGQRVLTPSDDPAAASQAVNVTLAQNQNTQFASNRTNVNTALSLSESTLQSVVTLLQNAQSTAIGANNGSLNNTDRTNLATTLQMQLDQITGLANSQDSNGDYLFSGTAGGTKPFVTDSHGNIVYQGNDSHNLVQVAANSQMASNVTGLEAFMNARTGNGTFVTSNGSGNNGSGIISQGGISSPAPTPEQVGNSYTLTFSTTSGGALQYSISGKDVSGASLPTSTQPGALPTNQTFVSGQSISINGIQFSISGTPQSGDTFNVTPSTSTSVFQTLQHLITTLQTALPAGNAAAAANFTQQLSTGVNNLGQSLNQALNSQAAVGANLGSLSTLDSAGTALNLQYQTDLTQLTSLDYNQAVSQFTAQQTELQAAMQSFKTISGLSLFNYL